MGIGDYKGIGSLGLVVALAWLALALPPVAVAIGETFDFDPTSGVADQVVIVRGTNWIAGEEVRLFPPGVDPGIAEPWETATALEDGTFVKDVALPRLPAGSYNFFACQACVFGGGDESPIAFATIDIQRHFALDSAKALPDTVVGFSGSGWSPDDGNVMLFASREESLNLANTLANVPPLDDGTLGDAGTFTVPGRPAAKYTFVACQLCDLGSKALVFEVDFEITEDPPPAEELDPDLELDPVKQSVGEEVTVHGTGWSNTAGPVSVYADESDVVAGRDVRVTAAVSGGEFSTTLVVPDRNVKLLTVFACQLCGDSELEAETTLTITTAPVQKPVLRIRPATGRPGESVTATGAGWLDGPVTVSARRTEDGPRTHLATPTASNGGFKQELTVPPMDRGPIEIAACQRCGTADESAYVVQFTIVAEPVARPVLTVEPQDVEPGDTVTLSGAGWSADDGVVKVYLEPERMRGLRNLWLEAVPDLDATFSAALQARDLDDGTYRVVACQRCGSGLGQPRARKLLEISSGGPNPLMLVAAGGGGMLVVGALVTLLLRRRHRTLPARPSGPDRPETAPPPEPPVVHVVADDMFEVEPSHVTAKPAGFELPSLDIVPLPDPVPLADQVEVTS